VTRFSDCQASRSGECNA